MGGYWQRFRQYGPIFMAYLSVLTVSKAIGATTMRLGRATQPYHDLAQQPGRSRCGG